MIATLLALFHLIQAIPYIADNPDEKVFKLLGMFVPVIMLFLCVVIIKSLFSTSSPATEQTTETTPRRAAPAAPRQNAVVRPNCSYCGSAILEDAGTSCPKCGASVPRS